MNPTRVKWLLMYRERINVRGALIALTIEKLISGAFAGRIRSDQYLFDDIRNTGA